MSTISVELAREIAENDGYTAGSDPTRPDNPRCLKIVVYQNMFNGGESFGAVFEHDKDLMKYEKNCHVINVYWRYEPNPPKPDADGWVRFAKPLSFGPLWAPDGTVIDTFSYRALEHAGRLLDTEHGHLLIGHSMVDSAVPQLCALFQPTMIVRGYKDVWE